MVFWNNIGSSFFVIDSLIAGIIILTALFTLFTAFGASDDHQGMLTIVEDTLRYVQNTQVRDFQGNYTQTLIRDDEIKDPATTIFSQVAKFHQRDNITKAEKMLAEVLNTTVPPQYSVAYIYNTTTIYERTNWPRNTSNTVLNAQRTSVVTINRSIVYGPHPAKVVIWSS